MGLEDFVGGEPSDLLEPWMAVATETEINDPNAAALATVGPDGRPSVRMVLIKKWNIDGFRFFTNEDSRKGFELRHNPFVSICLHWKSLRRQIRVSGPVSKLDEASSDEYFHSRSRLSQIASAVSQQSRPLKNRAALLEDLRQYEDRYAGRAIPRPNAWKGFVLHPEEIEFWIDGDGRLHERLLFLKENDGWKSSLLYP